MARRVKSSAAIVGGLIASSALFIGLALLLPPVVPAASQVTASPTPKTDRQASPAASSTAAPQPTKPYGFLPISYGLFQSRLDQEARSLRMNLVLPRASYANTVLEDTYTYNSVLYLHYNNMVVMESSRPIPSSYSPFSTVAVTLTNGIGAAWEWIPGIGGPQHRLMFQDDGTYVRLQLYAPTISGTLASAEHVAAAFVPMPTS